MNITGAHKRGQNPHCGTFVYRTQTVGSNEYLTTTTSGKTQVTTSHTQDYSIFQREVVFSSSLVTPRQIIVNQHGFKL